MFWSKDLCSQTCAEQTLIPLLNCEKKKKNKENFQLLVICLIRTFFFPLLRLLLLQRGDLIQGHDSTSSSSMCCLVELMLREPWSVAEESSWLLAWGPRFVGLERDTAMASLDDPGEVREGFLCPLCLKDLQSFYQLHSHYEEEHSGEDRDVKGQIKSKRRRFCLSHSVSGSFNSWDSIHQLPCCCQNMIITVINK